MAGTERAKAREEAMCSENSGAGVEAGRLIGARPAVQRTLGIFCVKQKPWERFFVWRV